MSNYEKLREYCIDKDVITIDCTCLCGHDELDHRSHHGIFRGECEHGDCCKEFQVDASKPQMQIADVLRALDLSDYVAYIQSNGRIRAIHCEHDFHKQEEIVITFNLSLPLSHPDNAEACGKVYDLIIKQ